MLVAVQLSVPGSYLPPVFKWLRRTTSAPDDHFTAGPHCRVTASGSGRVGGAGGRPTIRAGIVSAAGVQIGWCSISAPDDHFAAGPHCRVTALGQRARWWCWWPSNCPCWDCISRRCSNRCRHLVRPRRSFRCRSTLPCDRFGQRARWWCWWLSNCRCWVVSSAGVQNVMPSYPPQTIISLPVHTAV